MQETRSLWWGRCGVIQAEPGRQKQPGSREKTEKSEVQNRDTHQSKNNRRHKHVCTRVTKRIRLRAGGKGRGLNRHKGGYGNEKQVKIINYHNQETR